MDAAEQREYPFWDYHDLVVFLGMALPSLLISTIVVRIVFQMTPLHNYGRALELLVAQFSGYALWFASLYLLLHVKYGAPFWSALRWTPPARGLWTSLFGGPLLAFGIAFLGVAMRTPDLEMPIKSLMTDRFSLLLMGLFATTLGPVCEELAFRGFILPLVARSLGTFSAIVITALPFALLHGPQYSWSWRHLLLLTFAGMAFGWTRHRTGSTAASAFMHASYNLTFFVGYVLQMKDHLPPW